MHLSVPSSVCRWCSGGADAGQCSRGLGGYLVPRDPQDPLPTGLEQCLALGIVLARDLVIVPRNAVGLDYEAFVGPPEVRHDSSAFHGHGAVHVRVCETVAKEEVKYEVLQLRACGRWASSNHPDELANAPPGVAKPIDDLHQLAKIHQPPRLSAPHRVTQPTLIDD